MRYLDANVFIYAAVDDGPLGEAARQVIRGTTTGTGPAVTSALTLDEVAWKLIRLIDREAGVREASKLVGFPHLALLDVRAKHLVAAFDLMEEHRGLGPRDAIHAAVAIDAGVFTIVSTDADFDAIPQLTRQPLASA